jgi:hypothetical protein
LFSYIRKLGMGRCHINVPASKTTSKQVADC